MHLLLVLIIIAYNDHRRNNINLADALAHAVAELEKNLWEGRNKFLSSNTLDEVKQKKI